MDINQCIYTRNFTRNILVSVIKNTSLVHNMYTNIHSHQHKITQLSWINPVHTCNIYIFDNVTVWSLYNQAVNWWFHQKIDFQKQLWHTLTYSGLMVLQNSCNIMGSTLFIDCPNPQKLYFLHWPVEILQLNPIILPLVCPWNHLLINTSESLLMMLKTSCIQ